MATYTTNEFRGGLKILLDGEPYNIMETEFVKPGKGQAFYKTRIRNLKTGRVLERTFRSGETVEAADVHEAEMQFLYYDGDKWHFMVPSTYEQYEADEAAMEDSAQWIKEEDRCMVMLYNNFPLSVTPPNFVELRVAQTDPGVRGDTSSGGTKPATMETGAIVKVPLFIQEGEVLRIDTRTGDYVSRVKE